MYTQQQQQQQHHVPFTNLQQQFFASSPFLLSYPSGSALHPPGTDPLANSTPSVDASAYGSQIADYQNWIIKQAESIRYDLAVGSSSHETLAVSASFPSTWNGTWSHQVFTNDTSAMLPKQTKVTKPMRCEVCEIDCNSKDVYEKHILGKKHKRNLQLQTNPSNTIVSGPSQGSVQNQTSGIQGQVFIGAAGEDLESKKRKVLKGGAPSDSVRVCTVCNIVCNSQEVFTKHLAGKKHAAQVGLISNNGIGPYIAAFKCQGIGPWEKAPKKMKVVTQSVWCEVCKINCNSRDMYIVHLSGKKHLKNLEKLSKPQMDADAGAGATTANALQPASNPIIGPQEKPDAHKPKSKKEPDMDIEAKKRKVVEGGAAAAAVRLCTLCNVVCNSQTVFDTHLAGHKHSAMVKKQTELRGTTTS